MEKKSAWRREMTHALSEQRRRAAAEEHQTHREAIERMFQPTPLPPSYTPYGYGWPNPLGYAGL